MSGTWVVLPVSWNLHPSKFTITGQKDGWAAGPWWTAHTHVTIMSMSPLIWSSWLEYMERSQPHISVTLLTLWRDIINILKHGGISWMTLLYNADWRHRSIYLQVSGHLIELLLRQTVCIASKPSVREFPSAGILPYFMPAGRARHDSCVILLGAWLKGKNVAHSKRPTAHVHTHTHT